MRKTFIYKFIERLSKKRSRQGLYEFLMAEYKTIKSDSKVLTVGSGGEVNRILLEISEHNSFGVISLDIDPARKPDIVGDICSHNFGFEQFDVVVICEVLEHIQSPHIALEKIYDILKNGGKLILSTPFILPMHDKPYDYFRFTKYGLKLLLSQFKEIKIKERNSYFEAIDVLWVRLLQEKTKRSFLASLIIIPIVYYFQRPLTLFLSWALPVDGMTTGYVVTAIK